MNLHPRPLLFLVGLCMIGAGLHVALSAQDLKKPRRECSFELTYDIKVGPRTRRVVLTALVPRDLEHRQQVKSLRFSPEPERTFTRGGEKYARWDIQPRGDFTIRMRARMVLERNDLQMKVHARRKSRVKPAPPKDLDDCLAAERFIECRDRSIREAAAKIAGDTSGDTSDDLARARATHAFVLRQMQTRSHNPKDVGAVAALAAGRGDCTDYSDLFVALCRAQGIPARAVEGYTTSWSNVAQHSWAEVWLRDHGWVSFDPFRAEWLGTSFDTLKNIYVQLTHTRNDRTLRGYHIYCYDYEGDAIHVVPEFKPVD